jgi:hypothetical protein
MATKYMDAVDQRDALLEALKDVLRYVSPVADGAINARAAIAPMPNPAVCRRCRRVRFRRWSMCGCMI